MYCTEQDTESALNVQVKFDNSTHGFADISSPLRFLQDDDVADDYVFEEDDVEDYNPKMAPANTKTDDDKSANIKKYLTTTDAEITRMIW